MSMPATIGPTPKISVSVVCDAVTAVVIRCPGVADDDVEMVEFVDELDRLTVTLDRGHVVAFTPRAVIVPG